MPAPLPALAPPPSAPLPASYLLSCLVLPILALCPLEACGASAWALPIQTLARAGSLRPRLRSPLHPVRPPSDVLTTLHLCPAPTCRPLLVPKPRSRRRPASPRRAARACPPTTSKAPSSGAPLPPPPSIHPLSTSSPNPLCSLATSHPSLPPLSLSLHLSAPRAPRGACARTLTRPSLHRYATHADSPLVCCVCMELNGADTQHSSMELSPYLWSSMEQLSPYLWSSMEPLSPWSSITQRKEPCHDPLLQPCPSRMSSRVRIASMNPRAPSSPSLVSLSLRNRLSLSLVSFPCRSGRRPRMAFLSPCGRRPHRPDGPLCGLSELSLLIVNDQL